MVFMDFLLLFCSRLQVPRRLKKKKLAISHLLSFSKGLLICSPCAMYHIKMVGLPGIDSDFEDFSEQSRNHKGNYYPFMPICLFKKVILSSIIQKGKPRPQNVNLPRVSQQRSELDLNSGFFTQEFLQVHLDQVVYL